MENKFESLRADENNSKWNQMIKREKPLYQRNNDIRNEFERDYTRVIHSTAFRRMKHKTQVFFMPENDHICTRMEHVMHVESVSSTIAKYLGLNTTLTRSIATAHDIGHSPFGHQGEKVLSEIAKRDCADTFWHEKNGVTTVDRIELLDDDKGNPQTLNLTYAVRDGIISHCGEIDENCIKPRDEAINLDEYTYPNQYSPYTWEGCVVKVADKISYLGRDIEDAITMGVLDKDLKQYEGIVVNNTVLINDMIYDICENSNPEVGIKFSDEMFEKINRIKRLNYEHIYLSEKLLASTKYFSLIINQIYDCIRDSKEDRKKSERLFPELIWDFYNWRSKYDFKDDEFEKSIIYFIAGMTDNYAIKMYNSIISF